MIWEAKWVKPVKDFGEIAPMYEVHFFLKKPVKKATLWITALGVYEAVLNGERVGKFILAPGWTSYHKRLQYQEYDVTGILKTGKFDENQGISANEVFSADQNAFMELEASSNRGAGAQNCLRVLVGKGWYRSRMPGWGSRLQDELRKNPPALLAQLEILYEDGTLEKICTDAPQNSNSQTGKMVRDGQADSSSSQTRKMNRDGQADSPSSQTGKMGGGDQADNSYSQAERLGGDGQADDSYSQARKTGGDGQADDPEVCARNNLGNTVPQACRTVVWKAGESPVRFSEIYDGEIYDARIQPKPTEDVENFDGPFQTLIPQQGEEIREQERILGARKFTTPKGETIIDFGQEVTGYVETAVTALAGEIVDLSFAEVMDKDGNFYNENYRGAKAQYHYICREGSQTYKPRLTFWGFRYIRINQFPGGVHKAMPEFFTAVAVHSDMKRTGYLRCSNPLLNRLFDNCVWGQKGNFLDVPTDCPQRDERLGWTGDAQVFVRTACLNYDAEKFFTKWLADMRADQGEDGYVGHVIPDLLHNPNASTAWGDAATICPWEVYLAYGNLQILENQFTCMQKWVDYITLHTTTEYLWTGGEHYGDWLALDVPTEQCDGASRKDFIASAFYAHSTSLVIKAGRVLGKDVSAYEKLYDKIVETFRKTYSTYETQTECVLAAHFGLAPDPKAAADQLAASIQDCGGHLKTGFVGTPYLLHVLNRFGYTDLAYSLLLREEYPSWLYPVTRGATTVWEHWDGIMVDGGFWSPGMNSFNHYAYGSVVDWVYGVAAGINPVEEFPGYAKVRIAPTPDPRLDWLEATLDTRHGRIHSAWKKEDGMWRYEITTPVEARIIIAGKEYSVAPGTYYYFSQI